jgi:murein DD-endopeptidase MepM/ murein hydrolase activator NlpD|nr:M23 family metallopeptidase [Candidatus Krumholzibacteria bacterium]
MKLKKAYTFLYMPEDHGPTRTVKVSRWGILTGVGVMCLLVGVGVLYGLGLHFGNGWLPGGSRLQKENLALNNRVHGLENQIEGLKDEVSLVYDVQSLVASAVNLEPLDAEVFAAGVGGRGDLMLAGAEVPGLDSHLPPAASFDGLDEELGQLLRQARIQRQGYQAILDTLGARESMRAKIPSIRPTDTGWLSSRFGFRNDPFTGKQTFHRGLDFSVPAGTDVRVTGTGKVVAVQQQRGLGKVVKVDHGNDVMTVYAHLDRILVKKGAMVERGQVIAKSGNSGRSTAPHLHYEIRVQGRSVNPITYILDSYASRN